MSELKSKLRREVKEQIKLLDLKYCEETNTRIQEAILKLSEYQIAETVFCFVGTREEIDTATILQDALNQGKCVAVPKCIGKGIMVAYQIQSLSELIEGAYGILEPDASKSIEIAPSQIDLALIPCLSANTKGQRIGYGGGFYDRYLEQTDAMRVVLCREQLMCEEIPVEEYDQLMEVVVSEERIIRV